MNRWDYQCVCDGHLQNIAQQLQSPLAFPSQLSDQINASVDRDYRISHTVLA